MNTLARNNRTALIPRSLTQAFFWTVAAGTAVMAISPEDVLVFSAGPLRLRPQLDFGTTFDDNVFHQPGSGAKSDFIFNTNPGINLEAGAKDRNYDVELNYVFSRYSYVDVGNLSHSDHHFDLSGRARLEKWVFSGRGSLDEYTGILTGFNSFNESTGLSNFGRKVDRWYQSESIKADFLTTEKISTYAQGSFQGLDYASGTPLYDQNSFRGTLGGNYEAFSKASLFLESYYGQTAASPNFVGPKTPHLDAAGVFAGLKGEFSPKITGSVQAGWEFRSLSNGKSLPSEPVVITALTYLPRPKTSMALAYSRSTGVSVDSTAYAFTSDLISLRVTQKLGTTEKWSVAAEGRGRWDSYEPTSTNSTRDDKLYGASLSLTYKIEMWLSTSFTYSYDQYTTSLPSSTLNYGDNRATLQFSIGY